MLVLGARAGLVTTIIRCAPTSTKGQSAASGAPRTAWGALWKRLRSDVSRGTGAKDDWLMNMDVALFYTVDGDV